MLPALVPGPCFGWNLAEMRAIMPETLPEAGGADRLQVAKNEAGSMGTIPMEPASAKKGRMTDFLLATRGPNFVTQDGFRVVG